VQGRSPNIAFLPIISLPELETWVETEFRQKTITNQRVSECETPKINENCISKDMVILPKAEFVVTKTGEKKSFGISETTHYMLTIH